MYVVDYFCNYFLVECLVCRLAVKDKAENCFEWTVSAEYRGHIFDIFVVAFHLMLKD